MIGVKAKYILDKFTPVDVSELTCASNYGLLPQPKDPIYKCALVESYVTSHPLGGTDKSAGGNRYDSVFIANGLIRAGMSCQVFRYVPDEHDAFCAAVAQFDGVVVRCNPGQINQIAGGSQTKFDDAMRKVRKSGVQV